MIGPLSPFLLALLTLGNLAHAQAYPYDSSNYIRNRYYEPETGQFTQVDPARAGDNWYAYAGADPVNRWDPSGLKVEMRKDLQGLMEEMFGIENLNVEDGSEAGKILVSIKDSGAHERSSFDFMRVYMAESKGDLCFYGTRLHTALRSEDVFQMDKLNRQVQSDRRLALANKGDEIPRKRYGEPITPPVIYNSNRLVTQFGGLDAQLALLSADIYNNSPNGPPRGWKRLSMLDFEELGFEVGGEGKPGLKWSDFVDPSNGTQEGASGFYAGLYMREDGLFALAFRGTNEWEDWTDNVDQAMGLGADQYLAAQSLARKVSEEIEKIDGRLILTGHSLGGGLATTAAMEVLAPAVIFNSAGVHPRTDRSTLEQLNRMGARLVTRFTVSGEILNKVQDNSYLPDSIGISFVLQPDPDASSVERHGLGSILDLADPSWVVERGVED